MEVCAGRRARTRSAQGARRCITPPHAACSCCRTWCTATGAASTTGRPTTPSWRWVAAAGQRSAATHAHMATSSPAARAAQLVLALLLTMRGGPCARAPYAAPADVCDLQVCLHTREQQRPRLRDGEAVPRADRGCAHPHTSSAQPCTALCPCRVIAASNAAAVQAPSPFTSARPTSISCCPITTQLSAYQISAGRPAVHGLGLQLGSAWLGCQ